MGDEETKFNNAANNYLTNSGQREKFVNDLTSRLLGCGWHDQVAKHCKDVVLDVGIDNISLDTLIERVTPKARELIPSEIKRDLLLEIQTSIESKFNVR